MSLEYIIDIVFDDDCETDGEAVLHECRHCGSKFAEETQQCTVCGTEEIASYRFETSTEDR